MMHTGNACIRLICILCVFVGCYSQTCGEGQIFFSTYLPTVTGLTCQSSLNGQYTFLDHFSGAERYVHMNGIVLFKPGILNSYIFAAAHTSNCQNSNSCPLGYITLARTNSFVLNAGSISNSITERCLQPNGVTFVWNERASTFLPNAVSQCTCDEGWAWSGSVCVKCNQGEYKSLIGRSACSKCPASFNLSIGGTALADCICNAGYTGGNEGIGECTPCSIGTYKANAGSGGCTGCPWGEYTTATGAVSSGLCKKCDFGNHPRSDGGGCEQCAISFEASVLTSASSGIAKRPGCIEFVT